MAATIVGFEYILARHGLPDLQWAEVTTLQVNVGKVCNQACQHCHDCDFNQMLEIAAPNGLSIWDVDSFETVSRKHIAVAQHCLGCTAGAGSSGGGKLT